MSLETALECPDCRKNPHGSFCLKHPHQSRPGIGIGGLGRLRSSHDDGAIPGIERYYRLQTKPSHERRERYALAAFAALLTGDPAVYDKNFTAIAQDAVQAADALIAALDAK